MNKILSVKKVNIDCPICDKVHDVDEITHITTMLVKDEDVEYEETYLHCKNADDEENEFYMGGMLDNNLQNARNAYRKKFNLLTSYEIVEIRKKYGLSQVDLARLLGWGEATISRYESKAIQDTAYDNILRLIKDNPYKAYEFWKKNKEKFSFDKRMLIRQRIIVNMYAYGYAHLKRQVLESEYIEYLEPSDYNGNQTLDINKLETIISYLAERVDDLYKVKLMKMLWYIDAIAYKSNEKSLTGLVYTHNNMGALPIGHYKIVDLENVKVEQEEYAEYTRYHFLPNSKLDMSCITPDEIIILNKVIDKFKNYSAQNIVNYMHEERAYKETKDGEIIPFSLAKEIRGF